MTSTTREQLGAAAPTTSTLAFTSGGVRCEGTHHRAAHDALATE